MRRRWQDRYVPWASVDARRQPFWAHVLPICLVVLVLALTIMPKAASWAPSILFLLFLPTLPVHEILPWLARIRAFRILLLWALYAAILAATLGEAKFSLFAIPPLIIAFFGICNWHVIASVPPELWRRNAMAAFIGYIASCVLLILLLAAVVKLPWLYPYAHHNSVYYNRGAVLVASLMPVGIYLTAALFDRRLPLVLVAVVAIVPCWLSQSETAKLCSTLGLLLMWLWRQNRELALVASLLGVTTAFLLWLPAAVAASAAIDWFAPNMDRGMFGSLRDRLGFYSYAASLVKNGPIWGHGVHALQLLHVTPDGQPLPTGSTSHPHSAIVQIWLDGGGVAMVAALATLWLALIRLARAATPQGDVMAVTLIVCVAGSAVSHGLWQSWFHGTSALALALGTLVPKTFVSHHARSNSRDL